MLITDLELIRKLSIKNEDQNWRFRSYLKMQDENEIIEKYTEIGEDRELLLRGIPCCFLNGNECKIYKNRPYDCESYPHLHKKRFIYRLFGIIDNLEICPIVYNVYEQLKIKLNFR